MGDNPYPPGNVPKFRTLIQDVNARAGLEWVIHVGDIRGGGANDAQQERNRPQPIPLLHDALHRSVSG